MKMLSEPVRTMQVEANSTWHQSILMGSCHPTYRLPIAVQMILRRRRRRPFLPSLPQNVDWGVKLYL
jgi:hypothetical protein